jgi:hypothetical protein
LGLPTWDFPGLGEAEPLRHQPVDRVRFLETAFGDDLVDTRFIPYIQLHEFEAYLFSDPTWFAYFYDHHDAAIAALKAIAEQSGSPELIDDGPDSAPSKRNVAHLSDYADARSAIGPQVAELIGLAAIRGKCPHIHAWISHLEGL